MKRCNKCGRLLDESEFYMRKSGNRAGQLYSICKLCECKRRSEYCKNNKEKIARKNKERYKNIKDKAFYKAKYRYGITREEYDSLIRKCQICGSETNLTIDRSIETGEIRGMLCQHCKHGVIFFKDNPVSIERAREYLYGGYRPFYPSLIIYEMDNTTPGIDYD